LFCGSEDVVGHPIRAVHARRIDVEVVGELRSDDVDPGRPIAAMNP
jgi:hypothetical protein